LLDPLATSWIKDRRQQFSFKLSFRNYETSDVFLADPKIASWVSASFQTRQGLPISIRPYFGLSVQRILLQDPVDTLHAQRFKKTITLVISIMLSLLVRRRWPAGASLLFCRPQSLNLKRFSSGKQQSDDGMITENLPDISPYPYQPLRITEEDYQNISGNKYCY